MQNKTLARAHLSFFSPNLVSLLLTGSGSIILAWVGWLTWYDLTVWGKAWNKDIALIFFGSRTGEAISLGVGMRVIYYFLISLALILSGMFTFLRKRRNASKLHPSRSLPIQRMKETARALSKEEPTTKQPIRETEDEKDKVSLVVKPLISETEEKMSKEEPTTKQPIISLVKEEIYFSGCLHHFGYLASRPKGAPIPEECIICQKLGDCMVATVKF